MLATNPYKIDGPAIVSFSGGRTSGYMLHEIIVAHGGTLPENVQVVFCNTGKERGETLDFVQACQDHFRVHVSWLERAPNDDDGFRVVTRSDASRDGEPFTRLMREKQYLPNPVTRFCTIELKIRVIRDFALEGLGWDHWKNIVGLRADEPGRVLKALAMDKKRWTNHCPLSEAGATEDDVLAFWKAQPFDLALKSYEGNCDLCFLKGAGKITRIMRERPDLAKWWIEAEAEARSSKPSGARFRDDRPNYAALLDFTERQGVLPLNEFDDHQSCDTTCTD